MKLSTHWKISLQGHAIALAAGVALAALMINGYPLYSIPSIAVALGALALLSWNLTRLRKKETSAKNVSTQSLNI